MEGVDFMLSEEEKQKRLENYRKRKEKLSEEEIKTKEKKQNLLARIKIQRDKIKKSENKQKEIRDAKDMELVKMLRDIHGEEDIDNLLLDALGIEENNTEEERIRKEHENE
jgi:hypothetical protein